MPRIPELDPVTTIADNDVIMIPHSDGWTEKITGANLKSQVLTSISNLTANTAIADTDIIYIKESGGTLKKITGANLKASMVASLDVSSVGGSGKYISAISETNGKISATATNLATEITSNGTTPPNGTAVFNFGKYIEASSKTITGPTASSGLVIRVLFTSALNETGSATKLQLTYNSSAKTVKVYNNGTKNDFTYKVIDTIDQTKRYLQAGTTLELMFDGTDFIILGNPIVLSGDGYAVRADGSVDGGKIGDIKACATNDIPYGWKECNGQAVSRTTYAALFSKFNTQKYDSSHTLLSRYGTGNGSTTFNLPDYREAALTGIGTNDKDTIPNHDTFTLGQYKDDNIKDHSHYINNIPWQYSYTDNASMGGYTFGNFKFLYDGGSTSTNALGTGNVNRGKRKGVIYIIKVL